MSKFPETSAPDFGFGDIPSPKKSIKEDWGAETEAGCKPNTPSMEQKDNIGPYWDPLKPYRDDSNS